MKTAYPPYKKFPILTSNQIVLRQVTNADVDEIIEISYYDGIQASSPTEVIVMQEKINQDYLQGNSIHWELLMPKVISW